MDGFYVAKFKVEKRVKGSATTDSEATDQPVFVDEEFATRDVTSAVFDSDEDRPYLEGTVEFIDRELVIFTIFVESKRRRMKSKGLRPPPRPSQRLQIKRV